MLQLARLGFIAGAGSWWSCGGLPTVAGWFAQPRGQLPAEAARTWLHDEAEVIDTTYITPAQAANQIAEAGQH